jgi:pimeloyl-ACP methyl ester carboxylesterase
VQGFEEHSARIDGTRLRYEVGGEGPPLLLLHGLGGAASNWVELAPLLARRHRVLVPDLPGHGGSEPLAGDLDAFADLVARLAEYERLIPTAIVGHSAGGSIALRLAARRPDDVSAIVLAASAGISTGRRIAELTVDLLAHARPGRLLAPFRSRIARRPRLRYAAFGWWGASDPPALSAAAVDGFLAGPPQHTDTVTLGRALVRHDPRLDLERVACPCLVLWGARDNWVLLEDGFEFARRLRAPLRLIPDCGHLLIGERPDACLDAIEQFLTR